MLLIQLGMAAVNSYSVTNLQYNRLFIDLHVPSFPVVTCTVVLSTNLLLLLLSPSRDQHRKVSLPKHPTTCPRPGRFNSSVAERIVCVPKRSPSRTWHNVTVLTCKLWMLFAAISYWTLKICKELSSKLRVVILLFLLTFVPTSSSKPWATIKNRATWTQFFCHAFSLYFTSNLRVEQNFKTFLSYCMCSVHCAEIMLLLEKNEMH